MIGYGNKKILEKPPWLTIKAPNPAHLNEMKEMLTQLNLQTVCESAMCPNQGECFAKRTATFMILGKVCTRNCAFCAVLKGAPDAIDDDEPGNVAKASLKLGLKHVVITSVTRDDLPDGGAGHFASTINVLKKHCPGVTIEVLIPDFAGRHDSVREVVIAGPNIINHNIETIPRLYPTVRPKADYKRSLQLLKSVKKLAPGIKTKSGIMVGLGETESEIEEVFYHLKRNNCDMVTIGQYLRPSPSHLPVIEYITPATFKKYESLAQSIGLVASAGPFVRSSYKAAELYHNLSI